MWSEVMLLSYFVLTCSSAPYCNDTILDVFEDISKNVKKGKTEESEVGFAL